MVGTQCLLCRGWSLYLGILSMVGRWPFSKQLREEVSKDGSGLRFSWHDLQDRQTVLVVGIIGVPENTQAVEVVWDYVLPPALGQTPT